MDFVLLRVIDGKGGGIPIRVSRRYARISPRKNRPRRALQSRAQKTSASEKMANLVTPKSGGDRQKGFGHTATPHPSMQCGKSNASADES